jgi:hypothetical protein
MNSLWKAMIGQAVQVWMAGPMGGGPRTFYFGILEACDVDAMLLRQTNGETLFLPLSSIRRVEMFDLDGTRPENKLLRPAGAPNSETLVRPASDGSIHDSRRLVRPADAGGKTRRTRSS